MTEQIFNTIKNHQKIKNFTIPYGSLSLNLVGQDGKPINFDQKCLELFNRRDDVTHGALFAKEESGNPVNYLALTMKSKKASKVLLGIKDRIKEAVRKQLNPSNPGLIICFLESIEDLRSLANKSGLQEMSLYLLKQKGFEHIAAIGFSSEERITKEVNAESHYAQGLIFRNRNCRFNEQIKDFPFLSGQTEF